eukprot:scaffold9044_cov120-Isochrysis_galbana.AAC.2
MMRLSASATAMNEEQRELVLARHKVLLPLWNMGWRGKDCNVAPVHGARRPPGPATLDEGTAPESPPPTAEVVARHPP